jgi:hypothetical protein
MKPIVTAGDLDEVRALPRALIFIYVNWAGQARDSDRVFRDFVAARTAIEQEFPLPVYRADLSDQEGEVWEAIRNWLREEGQPYDPLTYGGYGALLWVCSGAVVAFVSYVAVVGRDKLVTITKSLFASEHDKP